MLQNIQFESKDMVIDGKGNHYTSLQIYKILSELKNKEQLISMDKIKLYEMDSNLSGTTYIVHLEGNNKYTFNGNNIDGIKLVVPSKLNDLDKNLIDSNLNKLVTSNNKVKNINKKKLLDRLVIVALATATIGTLAYNMVLADQKENEYNKEKNENYYSSMNDQRLENGTEEIVIKKM